MREIRFSNQLFAVKKISRSEKNELDNIEYKYKKKEYRLKWYSGRELNHRIEILSNKCYIKIEDDIEKRYRKWILWTQRGLKCIIVNKHHADIGLDRVFVKLKPREALIIIHRNPDTF